MNIPIGFEPWLRTQRARSDDIGALARRVASGHVSPYRPDDCQVIPPAELRAVIGRAVAEYNRRQAPAARKPASPATSSSKRTATGSKRTTTTNAGHRCKGCGGGATQITVRAPGGVEHWHHSCRARSRAKQPMRATGGRPTSMHTSPAR